jgi:hypothetical protein
MPLLNARDALAFPGGDNSSDTVISNVHFNLTTLENWNYTLYSNGTLSNGSWCLLTFQPYTPSYVLPNGTFLNVTWCWSPTEPIGVRAGVAIGYAVLFGIALVLSLVCLNKHGKLHLPAEKRFFPIGRRWQWYWASWVCATAIISLLTCVDVDRYFLPELPIILTSFFWYLMQWGTLALVWEAVRHWGSWMERQFIDPDPFALRDDDKRSKVEFYLPLLFYLFLWLVYPPHDPTIRLRRADHPCAAELLHDRSPELVRHPTPTLPAADARRGGTHCDRCPLQSRRLPACRLLAHNRILPAPLDQILLPPQSRRLQPHHRLRPLHTAALHAPHPFGRRPDSLPGSSGLLLRI